MTWRSEMSPAADQPWVAEGARAGGAIVLDDDPALDPGIAQALRPFGRRAELVAPADPGADVGGTPFGYGSADASRWDAVVIIDDSVSMSVVWRRVTREFVALLRRHDAFRNVHVRLMENAPDTPEGPMVRPEAPGARPQRLDNLVEVGGRRMAFVLSDGVGPAWESGAAVSGLGRLARAMPTAIVHMLPQESWGQTAVDAILVQLSATAADIPNVEVRSHPNRLLAALLGDTSKAVPLPVLTLAPGQVREWAEFVAGTGSRAAFLPVVFAWPTGLGPRSRRLRRRNGRTDRTMDRPDQSRSPGAQLVAGFRTLATPTAFELATRLAAAPLNCLLVHAIRQGCAGAARAHLGELFAAGLLQAIVPRDQVLVERRITMDFVAGAREELLAHADRATIAHVLRLVEGRLSAMMPALRGLTNALDDPGGSGHRGVTVDNFHFRRAEAAAFRALSGRHLALSRSLGKALEGFRQRGATVQPSSHGESTVPESLMSEIIPSTIFGTSVVVGPANDYVDVSQPGGSVPTPTDTRRRPRSAQPSVMGNIAPRNPLFIGRVDLLDKLHAQLQRSGTMTVLPQALHGTGGVGKTQLAMEYAYRHQGDYDIVWWIPAETQAQVSAALVELAKRLELPGAPTANTAIPDVREALRRGEPYANWLLIFDNAESPQVVSSLFPSGTPPHGNGNIIVTSRNPEWTALGATLEVDVFAREESVELLRKRDPLVTDADADSLAAALGDLPLAVEQIAAYIATTGIPAGDALRLVEDKLEVLDDPDQRPLGYPTTVAATWDLALEALKQQNPAALRLLEVCAFLAPDVSRSLLSAGRGIQIDPALDEALRDVVKLNRAIRSIGRYSLVKIDHRHNSLQMHRLLQRVLINKMTDEEQSRIRHGAHQLLAAIDPGQPESADRWPLYGELYPHVLASGAIDCPDSWVRQLVANLAKYLWYWGEHRMARDIAQQAYEAWSVRLGPDNPETLSMARWFGFMHFVVGEYSAAATLNSETLERHQQVLGDDHEDTLEAIGAVAADQRVRGDFNRALDLSETVLHRSERIFGPDDPTTLNAAHNVAVSLRLAGEFQRALELDQQTWMRKVEIYGADHLTSLTTLGGMNIDRRELGDFVGARAAQEDLVANYRQLLGDERHPTLLRAQRSLAVARRKAGDHEMALALSSQTHRLLSERYGDKHPDTVLAALDESVDRRENKDLRTARVIGGEARDQFRLLFGEGHPHTMAASVNLATTLRLSGEVNAARTIDEVALRSLEERLGGGHLLVQACAVNLASDLYYQGEFLAAHERDVATLEKVRELLGEDHPTTLACAANLSLDLRALGRTEEAAALLAHTIRRFERVLQPGHPAISAAQNRVRASCDMDPMPL